VIPQRQHIEPPPNTERMMRVAQQQGLAAPTAALALRTWEPGGGVESERNVGERHSLSGTLDRRLILWSEPESARAASYRSLRDSLVNKNLPRVVAVSSASFLNGTTTCAVNLALALTELPQTKVLLLDANFYEPALAGVFTIDRLTQIAPKEPWLKPYTIVSVSQSLHVAGIVKADVTGRMEPQQRFESLIDRLCRANYDYIIVDTPALKGSAVVSMVSGCDGCILAVRAGSTTARDLRRAADQLPPKKALGVALVDGGER
jgi:Mrp family chromosome partitioning ATPase